MDEEDDAYYEQEVSNLEFEEMVDEGLGHEVELTNFHQFENYWHNHFDKAVWNSDLYQQMLMHTLLGQIFKNITIRKGSVELDGRISIMLIQDQGTGKNTPFKTFVSICNKLNDYLSKRKEYPMLLRCKRLDEFSDAAMIGTTKMIIDEKGKNIISKVDGLLSIKESEIIIVKEAKRILSAERRMSSVVQYINMAIEPLSANVPITKILATGTTECYSHASFIMTSYPTFDIDIELLNSGLFRRMLVYYNRVPVLDKKRNISIGLKNLQHNRAEMESFENTGFGSEDIIVEYLLNVYSEFVSQEIIVFEFSDEIIDHIDKFVAKEMVIASRQPFEVSQVLTSIISSYIDYLLVIAAHRSLLNKSNKIAVEDAEYAEKMVAKLFKSIRDFIVWIFSIKLNSYKFNDMEDEYKLNIVVTNLLNEYSLQNKKVSRKELVEVLQQYASINNEFSAKSRSGIYKAVGRMVKSGIISEDMNGCVKVSDI